MNLKLLVVEGNLIEENQNFKKAGIETHTESLSDSLSYFNKNIDLDVVNPSSDKSIMNKAKDLNKGEKCLVILPDSIRNYLTLMSAKKNHLSGRYKRNRRNY